MPNTTLEAPRQDAKGASPAKDSEAGAAAEAGEEAAPKSTGGLKPWLPLLAAVVTMPLLAFATTRFVLLPRMARALGSPQSGAASGATTTPTAASESAPDKGGATGGTKVTVPMNKLLVNVAGTMGTRYLMTSVTLVGNTPDFKARIEDNKDQLMDLATGTLSSKTIADLEKPGARNVIRSELMTVLNNALGGPVIQEIYITELAIQ